MTPRGPALAAHGVVVLSFGRHRDLPGADRQAVSLHSRNRRPEGLQNWRDRPFWVNDRARSADVVNGQD